LWQLIGLFENLHLGQLSCAAFADSRILVTAGVDCVISVWSVTAPSSKQIDLQPKTSLFGHKHPVSTIAISRSFSTILSASIDGQVLLWDLNQLEFVRKLAHGRQVECAQINDVSGDIMLCRGQKVALYTLNGELIMDENVCTDHDDYIFSCAFYEGTGNEWLECTLVFTGHRRGVVNIWKKCVKDGKWALSLVKRLDHTDQRAEDGGNIGSAITCITPMPQAVYTGDEDGRVVSYHQ
jgi:WD40 repeat protein